MRVLQGLGRGGDERGAISAFLALGIVVFLSMAALSIDLGMLMQRRTEAQRTADGAALAGAASLIYAPGNVQSAETWAQQYAAFNDVGTKTIALRSTDIDVILPDTVRVRVLRSQSYGGPVSTLFARLFGTNDVDVATVAAAWAGTGTSAGASCILPVALPDKWDDTFYHNPSVGTPEWDPTDGDVYHPPYLDPPANTIPNPQYTGYGTIGEVFVLLPSQGGSTPGPPPSTRLMPGMWELWLPPLNNGVPPIRQRIMGCPDGVDSMYVAGDSLYREAGNRQTLADSFKDIILNPQYASQYYDGGCQCVRDGAVQVNGQDAIVQGGLRYRTLPVFDPGTYTQQGSGPHFEISHFIGVFIESVDAGPPGQANVYGRILPVVLTGGGNNTGQGPLTRVLKLVQ